MVRIRDENRVEELRRAEVERLEAAAHRLAQAALQTECAPDREADAVRRLADAIIEFSANLHAERMPRDVADALTRALRIMRYLDEAARLAPAAQRAGGTSAPAALRAALVPARAAGAAVPAASGAEVAAELENFERTYQLGKTALLTATAARALEVDAAHTLLDDFSCLRRLVQQSAKAAALSAKDRASTAASAAAGEGIE